MSGDKNPRLVSTFLGDKDLAFGAWAAQSGGDLSRGQCSGWGFKADYPNDLWDVFLTYQEFGDALEPALGFLPCPGTRQAEGAGRGRTLLLGAPVLLRFFELFLSRVDRLDGTTESWEVFTGPWNAVTYSSIWKLTGCPRFERLDELFEVAEGW